jgi:hypothetical protein
MYRQQYPWIGSTLAPRWQGGYGAFGLSVPTPLPGQPNYAPNMTATGFNYCGSKYGMQQMLQDLGYYKGPIDGDVGSGTLGAMRAFSTASGVPIGSGGLSNAWCQALLDAWQSKMQPPAAPAPQPAPTGNGGGGAPAPNGQPSGNGQPAPNGNGTPTTNGTSGKSAIDKAKDWWNGQSTGVKAAIGIGGVAVVGLIIYALVGGKKKATPNRRSFKTWPRGKKPSWRSRRSVENWKYHTGNSSMRSFIGRKLRQGHSLTEARGELKEQLKFYEDSDVRPNYRSNKASNRRLTKAQQATLGRIRGKRAKAKTGKITTLRSGKRYGHLKPPKRYYKMGAKRPSDYADPEHYKYPLVFRGPSGKVNVKRTKAHIRAAQSYFAKHKRKYPMATRRKIASSINKAKKRYGVGGKVVKA